MTTDRDGTRFHRTVLVVEVLGNAPYAGELADLSAAVTDGEYSGAILAESTTEVDRPDMAALLRLHHSDPDFLDAGEQNAEDGAGFLDERASTTPTVTHHADAFARPRATEEIRTNERCPCRSGYANNPMIHNNQIRRYGRCSCTCHGGWR